MSGVRWHVVADADALEAAAQLRVESAAARAIAARGRFSIVLSGGTTPIGVYRRLRAAKTDWGVWHVHFGDERCLPPENAERNSRSAAEAWLDHVPIPPAQRRAIPAELGARRGAQAAAEALRGVGDFDLVLLGLGEDGHTASLFPGRDWGAEPGAADALAVFDAPKPPRERVSLSAARLGRAREVLFLVAGAAKRAAVARWQAGAGLPAAAIRPEGGVDVLLDAAASPELPVGDPIPDGSRRPARRRR